MGQAFRRASGKIRASSGIDTSSSISKPRSVIDRQPPPKGPPEKVEISKANEHGGVDVDGANRANVDNVLEGKDQKYDAMLSQMVGRIRSKPGGKQELGEAFVVEKYNRPMPKLRNTKPDSGRYEERAVPLGTLNVAQLRHIILLHEGKADNHNGPMDICQIAEKFRVDVVQVQTILQYLSLPPEDSSKEKNRR
ncbi:Dynein beta chain, ciliary protein [Quillaja saponaria]|uniref:Dynein beta chain, ciliary protein n=1 Tax=Quillaja saponaria TaxID=32244 RepID=A0AAD7LD31_QUISA|nr:Dynein beta chain, ciliary protein [Quillaja saponaria]